MKKQTSKRKNKILYTTMIIIGIFVCFYVFFITKKDKEHIITKESKDEIETEIIEGLYEYGSFGSGYTKGESLYTIFSLNNESEMTNYTNNEHILSCGNGAFRRKVNDKDIFVFNKEIINKTEDYTFESALRYCFDHFIIELNKYQQNDWTFKTSEILLLEDNTWQYHMIGSDNINLYNIDIYCIYKEEGCFTFYMTKK